VGTVSGLDVDMGAFMLDAASTITFDGSVRFNNARGRLDAASRSNVNLYNATFDSDASIIVGGGTNCRIVSSTLPQTVLSGALSHLTDDGSVLQVVDVIIVLRQIEPGIQLDGGLSDSWAVIDGAVKNDGGQSHQPGRFQVLSGPCKLARRGRCVGRAGGYQQNERCTITVLASGFLAACPVFQVCIRCIVVAVLERISN
jgi:hypothetical protein